VLPVLLSVLHHLEPAPLLGDGITPRHVLLEELELSGSSPLILLEKGAGTAFQTLKSTIFLKTTNRIARSKEEILGGKSTMHGHSPCNHYAAAHSIKPDSFSW